MLYDSQKFGVEAFSMSLHVAAPLLTFDHMLNAMLNAISDHILKRGRIQLTLN